MGKSGLRTKAFFGIGAGVLFNRDGTRLLQYSAGRTATSCLVPNGVTSIANNTFFDSDSLVNITIPNTVSSIQNDAFVALIGLKAPYFPGNAPGIDPPGAILPIKPAR